MPSCTDDLVCQVVGVSMLYSGGIPILYLFASFSFVTNFLVDKVTPPYVLADVILVDCLIG